MFDLCNPLTINDLDVSQFGQTFTSRHLSYTNQKRIEINKICMQKFIEKQVELAKKNKKKAPVPLKLNKLDFDKNSQDVELLPNMPIIARVNNKNYRIANNETFIIESIKDTNIVVRSESSNNIIEIRPNQRISNIILYCFLYYSSQITRTNI
jgi:hypothetical protein